MLIPSQVSSFCQSLMPQIPRKTHKEAILLYLGQPISERKFQKETERCAKALLRWGIQPGSSVFLCLPQSPELLYCLFAIWQLGAVAHLIPPSLSPSSLKQLLCTAEGELLFLSEGYASRFCGFFGEETSVPSILVPLTQSLPLLCQYRLHGTLSPCASPLSYPRLLLFKEFLESGKSLRTAKRTEPSPDETAAVYYAEDAGHAVFSMSHAQLCKAAEQLICALSGTNSSARLLSQQQPWQAAALPALLLPFQTDLCLLLEPRLSSDRLLETILTQEVSILHCDTSFSLWLQEEGLSSALSSLMFLPAQEDLR